MGNASESHSGSHFRLPTWSRAVLTSPALYLLNRDNGRGGTWGKPQDVFKHPLKVETQVQIP
jgi:hypothetical protein